MSDNYQAVYDAVRSRVSNIDGQHISEMIIRNNDFSFVGEVIKQEFTIVAHEMQRPSVIFKPTLSKDGNAWIALLGDNLQIGVVGIGNSPSEAMWDFDKSWFKKEEE